MSPNPNPNPDPIPNPSQVAVAVSDDGRRYGVSDANYTFYDPHTKPSITACAPAYLKNQTDVTIQGTNFAPTGSGLKARWAPLGVTEATFNSSTAMRVRTPLLNPLHTSTPNPNPKPNLNPRSLSA